MRFLVVWWLYAQVTMAGGLERFGYQAGDISLYISGGGSEVCV